MSDTEIFNYPESYSTPENTLDYLEKKVEAMAMQVAEGQEKISSSLTDAKNSLSALKNRINPKELQTFERRIKVLEKAISDLSDEQLNDMVPPNFKDFISFDSENGILRINRGRNGVIQFSKEEMPVYFTQEASNVLVINYKDPATKTNLKLVWMTGGNDGKKEIRFSDKVSRELMGVEVVQFEDRNRSTSFAAAELSQELDEFQFTGNFTNDLAEINEMYKESTRQGGAELSRLEGLYTTLISRYQPEIERAPAIQRAEVYRRAAFLSAEAIFAFAGHGGSLTFNGDSLNLAEKALNFCETSLDAFNSTEGGKFANEQFIKLKNIINHIPNKLTPPEGGSYWKNENFDERRLNKILKRATKLKRKAERMR